MASGTIKVYLEVPANREREAKALGAKKHSTLGLWFVETIKEATEREEPALKWATPWSRGFSQSMSQFYRQLVQDDVPQKVRSIKYNVYGSKLIHDHYHGEPL